MTDDEPVHPPRHILAASDFSAGAQAAVARAAQLASEHHAQVTVVHVAPRGLPPSAVRAAARALAAYERAAPVAVRTAVLTGSAGVQIAAAAVRLHADLIVVGAHGEQHRPRNLLVGATAEAIIDVSDKPVLVVRGHEPDPYRTVLVAVDASPRAVRTAQAAVTLAPHAEHLLAHAVTVVGEQLLRLAGIDEREIAQLRDRQLAEAHYHLETLIPQVVAARPVRLVVAPGRPEDLIPELAATHQVDLVVVATKRVTSIRHLLLGSVTRHTIREAGCDVLVAHPSPRPDPDDTAPE